MQSILEQKVCCRNPGSGKRCPLSQWVSWWVGEPIAPSPPTRHQEAAQMSLGSRLSPVSSSCNPGGGCRERCRSCARALLVTEAGGSKRCGVGRRSEQSLQRGTELGSVPVASTYWLHGHGQGLSLCPPLKRATILPHRMILRLNKKKSVSEALRTVPSTLSVLIHVASQNSFGSSPSYIQVGSAAGVSSSKELEGSAETCSSVENQNLAYPLS